MEKIIKLENINKRYDEAVIFNDFKIEFYENKVNCILGKSGCGKTKLKASRHGRSKRRLY